VATESVPAVLLRWVQAAENVAVKKRNIVSSPVFSGFLHFSPFHLPLETLVPVVGGCGTNPRRCVSAGERTVEGLWEFLGRALDAFAHRTAKMASATAVMPVYPDRRHERTESAFGVLWLAVGGALLATPLFLRRRVWQLGWRMNGVGWAIAVVGFLLSGMGAFVCYANGLAMEGASKDLSFVGYLGVLAGAIIAVVGSVIAAAGSSKA
jgi:hypothetical protein